MATQSKTFEGSVCVRQRILPKYRSPFFDMLAERCKGGLFVIAGQPKAKESITTTNTLETAQLICATNRYRFSGVFQTYSQRELIRHVQSINPDVIVTEANPRFTDTNDLIKFANREHRKIVGWGIGTANFFNHGFATIRHIRRKRMVNRFDGLICYSERAAAQYQQLGVANEKLSVCYNSTVPRPETVPDISARNNSQPTILSVGRLLENKRFDILIRAAAIIQKSGTPLCVKIVGGGVDRRRLETIAADSGADVEFLGELRGEALATVGEKADLFVLPGLGGLALQEAMSFGLPVIASEADGTELDLIRGNGWLIEKENVELLSDTIRKALSDEKELRRMALESFRIVSEVINLEIMVDRFVAALNCFAAERKIPLRFPIAA